MQVFMKKNSNSNGLVSNYNKQLKNGKHKLKLATIRKCQIKTPIQYNFLEAFYFPIKVYRFFNSVQNIIFLKTLCIYKS